MVSLVLGLDYHFAEDVFIPCQTQTGVSRASLSHASTKSAKEFIRTG